jgi:iron complex outermembrane receptor protein
VAAYAAQPTPTATATTTQTTAKRATAVKAKRAKPATAKSPILLAQATAPQTTVAPPLTAQNQGAAQQELQTVVVTGSLIGRLDFQTPNPVQVLSANELTQTGFTNITDVLKNISSNGQGTLGTSFSFAFAGGASGIALHGLTVGDTLVMIDGERSVPYPLFDDNERDFVDVSAFPMYAVENIQVLSSGGSSLYGGDAIAGVVNVILRNTFQGFKATADYGESDRADASMEHFAFIGGHGDLDADGYNWYVSGEFRHQDQVLAANRPGAFTDLNEGPYGGFNLTPGAPAGTGPGQNPFYPSGAYGFVPLTRAGIIVNPATASLTNPNVGTNGLPGLTYLPGCSATAQAAGICTIPNPGAQLQPPSTQVDLLGKFHLRLSENWMFGLEASFFTSRTEQVSPIGGAFSSNTGFYPNGYQNVSVGPGIPPHNVPTSPSPITLPADYPGNPYGAPAQFEYTFPELGMPTSDFESDTERLLASLEGDVAGWHVKATGGAEFARLIETGYGTINEGDLQTALNNGYILGSSGTLAQQLFAQPLEHTPTSQLDLFNINATHNAGQLWAGPIKAALGFEWYKEAHDDRASLACQNGLVNCDPTFALGTEKDTSPYGELDIPIVKQLELDNTVRYDHFNEFGGSVSGDIAGLIKPFADTPLQKLVSFRANWGRSFRPPTAAEGISSGELFGAGSASDPVLCPNPNTANARGNFPSQCSFFPVFLQVSNPKLSSVHSTNWGAGIVLTPVSQLSLSADYYNIKVENDIITNPDTTSVRNPFTQSLKYCPPTNPTPTCSDTQLVTTTTPTGTIFELLDNYINAGNTNTSGIELDLDAHYDAGRYGLFSGQVHWTHLLTYQEIIAGTTFDLAGTHGPSEVSGDTGNPKDRATAQISWTKGRMTLSSSVYYTGSYSLTSPDVGVDTCSDGLGFDGLFPGFVAGSTPASFCSVGHFISTNFYAAYQINAILQIHASVENAFNTTPPLDFQTYGTGTLFYPYNAAFSQAGALGRFWTIGATMEF